MKLVTEEQKKPPNKRDISSTDFVGLFVDFSFEVMPVGGGGRQSTKYQRWRYAETYVTLTKSCGLILIHIRFLRLQQLGGSKRIGNKASLFKVVIKFLKGHY